MESPTNEVIIADEDEKCGHIFYHKQTMLLKYFCIFCEKIYDDIHQYCEHLSEHVYGETSHQTEQEVESDITEDGTNINSKEIEIKQADFAENTNVKEGLHQDVNTYESYLSVDEETRVQSTTKDDRPIVAQNKSNNPQPGSIDSTIIHDTIITTLPLEKLKEHKRKDVDVSGLQFTCYSCKHNFPNLMCLKEHRCKYPTTGKTTLLHKCTDCNAIFDDLCDMNAHIREVHHANEIICRFCGRSNFDSNEALQEHLRTRHNDNEEIFKCYICGRRYYLEANLLPHVWRHAKRVPQCCIVCGKMTLRLQHHMKFKHSPRPTRLLQCSICNKTFSYTSSLSRHKLLHKLPRTDISKAIRKDLTNVVRKKRKVGKWHASSANCIAPTVDSVAVETQTAVENIL